MSQQVTSFLTIGTTGVGKSSFLNLLADNQLFPVSDDAQSCTKDVTAHEIQLEDLKLYLIDCPGLDDSDGDDQKNMDKLHGFLKQHPHGLNIVALFISASDHRLSTNLSKYIKFIYKFFDHAYFWYQFCIIVTHCPNDEDELNDLKTKMVKGTDSLHASIITLIKQICNMEEYPEIPFFYFNSTYPKKAINQKSLPLFLDFTKRCKIPFPTQNLPKPDVKYQYSEEIKETRVVAGPQIPLYRLEPGEAIYQEVEVQEPYVEEEEREVEVVQEYVVYRKRNVDFWDVVTIGIDRLWRNNEIREIHTRKVKIKRKKPVQKYRTKKEKRYSGQGESRKILLGYYQQFTKYQKKYKVYWTYDCPLDDINNRQNPSDYGPQEEIELGAYYRFFDDKKNELKQKTNSNDIQKLRELIN